MNGQIHQQLGNYRIIKLLGHGGFADVYLGEHVYLKTQAAIKVLHTHVDEVDVGKFHTEALTVAHLVHPNIIHVLDFAVENATPFLIMEYAPAGNLRQRHPVGTKLPPATFLPYVRQIASALQYAHDQKLIHRDVKPENMLVGSNDRIVLSDFGIALASQNSLSQSTDEMVIGTFSYMSPEQIQGKARPASDQYALAVVVYEWLSGKRPFNGSYMEIVAQQLSAPPPLLDEHALAIPHVVQQVMQRALAKDPHQRFPRVQDFANALEHAYQQRSQPVMVSSLPSSSAANYRPPIRPVQPVARQARQEFPAAYRQQVPGATPSSPVKQPTRTIKKGLKWGLRALAIVVVLSGFLLCGLGFAAYHFFIAPRMTTVTNQAGATTLAQDFMQAVASRNYAHAYNDLGPPVTGQMPQTQFVQQAQSEDTCYGRVTGYKSGATTTDGNTLHYSYTMSRAKLHQSYELFLTLQQSNSGSWQIIDYNNNMSAAQAACP